MAIVKSINEIAKDIFDIVLAAPEIADVATAGQFVNVYLNDKSKLLPRPISICGINKKSGTVRIVFRIAGEGTAQMATLNAGDEIRVLGPLGNGFFECETKKAILFGGGIGIPPMLGLAKKLHSEGVQVTAVLGYRDNGLFLAQEFEDYADVMIATDDGSVGYHGNVVQAAVDAVKKEKLAIADTTVFACGPLPMLRGVKDFAANLNMPCQISMEERMACGIGACLACVCKSAEKDHHSNVNNKRVCKDGPVFFADEIEL